MNRLARELVVQEAALAQTWKHSGRAFMADQVEILPDDPEDPIRRAAGPPTPSAARVGEVASGHFARHDGQLATT
ncbi:hypothetical protein ACFZAR_41345 [Streptomyces sp. NPDC008222]|uniref:hypothetical protein n=1 Tax=Streptomyces sp. NPDC008222 TaxID=3364820 RepID=UPI0036EF010E